MLKPAKCRININETYRPYMYHIIRAISKNLIPKMNDEHVLGVFIKGLNLDLVKQIFSVAPMFRRPNTGARAFKQASRMRSSASF